MPNPSLVESRPAETPSSENSSATAASNGQVIIPGLVSEPELASHPATVDPATLVALLIAATGLWLHRVARRYG